MTLSKCPCTLFPLRLCSLKLLSYCGYNNQPPTPITPVNICKCAGFNCASSLLFKRRELSQLAIWGISSSDARNSFKLTHTLASDSPSPTAQELRLPSLPRNTTNYVLIKLPPRVPSTFGLRHWTTCDHAPSRSDLEPSASSDDVSVTTTTTATTTTTTVRRLEPPNRIPPSRSIGEILRSHLRRM